MLEVIANRRSIRKYNSKNVEEELVYKLLESARMAPSGSNTQPWNFIIVRSDAIKEEIVKADSNQQWMKDASVFIVCIADIRCRIKDEREIYLDENSELYELKQIIRDTAVAIDHIMLEAENLGLSTCWTGAYKQDEMRPIMNIPNDKYVVGVITIGYADEERKPAPRRHLEDMVRYEKWQ